MKQNNDSISNVFSPAINIEGHKDVFLFMDRPRHLTTVLRYSRDTQGTKLITTWHLKGNPTYHSFCNLIRGLPLIVGSSNLRNLTVYTYYSIILERNYAVC